MSAVLATRARRAGMTLVELIVAAGLLAFLLAAVFKLLDEFMTLWQRAEERRTAVEEASGVTELLVRDLDSLEPGPRGDLLAEWVFFDVDGDSVKETKWPRVRLVRHGSPAEIARLRAGASEKYVVRGAHKVGAASIDVTEGASPFRKGERVHFGDDNSNSYALTAESDAPATSIAIAPPLKAALDGGEEVHRVSGVDKGLDEGLIETIWAVLPANPGTREVDRRAEGRLWRGERIYGPARGADVSFFDPKFLSGAGVPRPGATDEVSSNVLWLGMSFATQTSILDGGWSLGREDVDCVAGWDAWNRARANAERHEWNQAPPGMVAAKDRPLLPRRVRLELELEHESDLKRRTRVARFMAKTDASLEVDSGSRLPAAPGAMVLVDSEWMEVVSVLGDAASVKRGQRGTEAAQHQPGALVHHGERFVREVPIALNQEDWDL